MKADTDFNDMVRRHGQDSVRRRIEAAIAPDLNGAAAPPSDVEPQAFPMLDPEALPGLVGEIVHAATESSEADPAAVLATLLPLVGIAAGRGVWVSISDDQHHARLFNVLVGDSARGRKGTSAKPVQRVWKAAAEHLSSAFLNAAPFIDQALNIRPGPLSTGEGLIYTIRDGDGDPEGDAGVPDKRLLVIEGEFAAVLRAMQRQGNTLSTALRVAWDGSDLAPMTKNQPIKTTAPHVGIVGHITRVELGSLLSSNDIFNGFANRFNWWCVRRTKLVPFARGMTDAAIREFGPRLAECVAEASMRGEVRLDDSAARLYEDLYPDLSADQDGLLGVVTARAEAQLIRFALTYAILDRARAITADHLQAAVAVSDFCQASASYLFGAGEPDPLANKILSLLESGPKTTTDLHDGLGRHTEGPRLKGALEQLQAKGRIERQDTPTGGRPRVTWSVRQGFRPAKKAN